jgi:hypothetical protein
MPAIVTTPIAAAASPARVRMRWAAIATAPAVAVAVAELVLRVWAPFPRTFPYYPGERVADPPKRSTVVDANVGWRFAPNAVIDDKTSEFHVMYRTNADGFRAMLPREASERNRVLFVGDSFTFGLGVDDRSTYVEQVAARNPGVRIFNYGMAGFGIDQMWRTLVDFGLREKPAVVIAPFIEDDLNRSLTSYRDRYPGWLFKPTYFLDGDRLVLRTTENSPGTVERFFQRLYLTEAWRRRWRRLDVKYGVGGRFSINRALFIAMRDACRAAGCELVAVHLPERGDWRPLPAFRDAFARAGIHYLDLGAVPVSHANELFYRKDPHLNEAGHLFVAEQLDRYLRVSDLLRRPPAPGHR